MSWLRKKQDNILENIMDRMHLNYDEKKWMWNFIKKYRSIHKKFIAPLLFAFSTFFVFTRLKNRVGQDIYFVLLIVIILYLKGISQNIGKMVYDETKN